MMQYNSGNACRNFLDHWKGKDRATPKEQIRLEGEAEKDEVLKALSHHLITNPAVYHIHIHFNGHGSIREDPTKAGAWLCAHN